MTALALPGPRVDPLLGHFIALRRDPLRLFVDAARAHGDAAPLHFGWIRALLVADPAGVRHVLQDNSKAYSKQTRGLDKVRLVLGNGLLTSEGDFWLRQRRIMQPAFHKDRLREAATSMAAATLDLAKDWERAHKSGTVVDVHHDMMALTLRIVCDTLLGANVRGLADEIGRNVTTVLEDINERTRVFFDVPLRVPTRRNRKLKESLAVLDGIVNRTIAEHRAALGTPAEKPDLLTLLLRARDEETGEGMTDQQLRDEVITFFLAGHETTANALAWSFYCLSKNPAADRELGLEVAKLDGRAPSFEEAGKLAYTNMVLKEAMRLYPPAWMLGRQAEQDDVIGGAHVARGTIVFASPYVTHRHPDYWENPEGFDPLRFSPDEEARRPRFAYFPFGGGPRLCIGQGFAMVEAAIALATLASRFRLELLSGHEVRPLPLITLRPDGPLPMRVQRR